MSDRMRILAVVPYPYDTVPGQRFRIEQWQPLLARDHGIDLTYLPFLDAEAYRFFPRRGHTIRKMANVLRGLARRAGEVRNAGKWDAAYLYREAASIGPALFERLLARRIPYVFDFDDAIFIPQTSEANRMFSFLKFPRKTDAIVRHAAHVTPGNEYLAEYSRRHNPNVTVIPTTIDTDKYTPRAKADSGVPVIGWTGSHTTVMYINEMRDVLAGIAKTHPFRLRVIGAGGFDAFSGIETEEVPWSSAAEVEDLRPIDIGLMPLRDDPWARGKCGLKALQYMSLGIPAVVSPVGVNTEIIDHGRNGFLASTAEEWSARLKELLANPEMRRRMGEAARETVETRYSARVHVPRLAEVFRSLGKESNRR